MTFATGSRNQLAYVAEVTYGTTPGTPSMIELPKVSSSLDLKKTAIESQTIRSDRQIADLRHGQRSVSGDIEVEFRADDYDAFLESALMSAFSTNVLKIGSTIKSFTIEDGQLDISRFKQFTGCVVDSMKLSLQPNQIAKMTFGMIGKDGDVATSALDASITAATGNLPVVPFDGTISEGGSAIAIITGLKLSLSNNLKSAFTIGAKTAPSLIKGKARVEGTVTAYFENSALLDKFIDETESSLTFTLTDGTSGNTYTFDIPRIKYSGADSPLTSDQERLITLPFIGLYDSGDATTMTITKS